MTTSRLTCPRRPAPRRIACAGFAAVAVATSLSCVGLQDSDSKTSLHEPSRDSAGIEIVEIQSLSNAPVLVLDSAFLELGGTQQDTNAEFDSRNPFLEGIQLSSGKFVINDLDRLKWFSGDGRLLRIAGRSGSGPGEFSQIRELCRLNGDSVLAIDYSSGTLTVWDSEGNHVATWSRPGFIPLGGCTSDGMVLVQTETTDPRTPYRTVNHALKKLNGELVRELGLLPAPNNLPPFFVEPSVIVSPGSMIVAPADSFTIKIHQANGHLLRVIRVLTPTRQISRNDLRERVSQLYSGSALDPQRAKQIERMMSYPHPTTYPAYGRVRVDSHRRIWVNDYEDRQVWVIFTESGKVLGRLRLSSDTELAGLACECVILRHRDSDGALKLSFHQPAF